MSAHNRREPEPSSSGSHEQGAEENKRPAEGYLSFASHPPPQLAPLATEQRLIELLATIGHEFRTPLTVINGYTITLLRHKQQLSAQEHDEFLQMIAQACAHLEYLLERLFEIAELEAGTVHLAMSLVDIPAVARESITCAHRHIPKPLHDRFTFQVHCRDEAGNQTEQVPPVKADARCLRKILGHLLDNAIRYSPAGGNIDVIVRPTPQEGMVQKHGQPHNPSAFLEICVCDFGLGIPDEHLEGIFEHFYRVDSSLTREVYGLGLGLTICRQLVALHHGRIWAESCPAGGSAFHVWLPLDAER